MPFFAYRNLLSQLLGIVDNPIGIIRLVGMKAIYKLPSLSVFVLSSKTSLRLGRFSQNSISASEGRIYP